MGLGREGGSLQLRLRLSLGNTGAALRVSWALRPPALTVRGSTQPRRLHPGETGARLGPWRWGVCLACLDKEDVTWEPVGFSGKACGASERTTTECPLPFPFGVCAATSWRTWGPWPLGPGLPGESTWSEYHFLAFVPLLSNTDYYLLVVNSVSNAIQRKPETKFLLFLVLFSLALQR